MGVNFSHATIVGWFELAAGILEPLDKPLQGEIITDEHLHSDESTLKACLVHMRRPLYKLKNVSIKLNF